MNRCFVVIEPDPLVRMDLVGALEDNFVDSKVQSFASLPDMARLALGAEMFVNGTLLREMLPALLSAIDASGGRIISIGSASTGAACILEIPFTTAMIVAATSSAGPGPRAHPPEAHT